MQDFTTSKFSAKQIDEATHEILYSLSDRVYPKNEAASKKFIKEIMICLDLHEFISKVPFYAFLKRNQN